MDEGDGRCGERGISGSGSGSGRLWDVGAVRRCVVGCVSGCVSQGSGSQISVCMREGNHRCRWPPLRVLSRRSECSDRRGCPSGSRLGEKGGWKRRVRGGLY